MLLSLAFPDLLAGTGTLLLGTVHLLYLFPSTATSDRSASHSIHYSDNITVSSITASLIHVYLIAAERPAAIYFPIHHRVFVSKRTKLLTFLLFQIQDYLVTALVGVSLLSGFMLMSYGLAARKIHYWTIDSWIVQVNYMIKDVEMKFNV